MNPTSLFELWRAGANEREWGGFAGVQREWNKGSRKLLIRLPAGDTRRMPVPAPVGCMPRASRPMRNDWRFGFVSIYCSNLVTRRKISAERTKGLCKNYFRDLTCSFARPLRCSFVAYCLNMLLIRVRTTKERPALRAVSRTAKTTASYLGSNFCTDPKWTAQAAGWSCLAVVLASGGNRLGAQDLGDGPRGVSRGNQTDVQRNLIPS